MYKMDKTVKVPKIRHNDKKFDSFKFEKKNFITGQNYESLLDRYRSYYKQHSVKFDLFKSE